MQCFLIILTIPSYSYTLCKTGCISGNGGAACFSWETLHSIMTWKTKTALPFHRADYLRFGVLVI